MAKQDEPNPGDHSWMNQLIPKCETLAQLPNNFFFHAQDQPKLTTVLLLQGLCEIDIQ